MNIDITALHEILLRVWRDVRRDIFAGMALQGLLANPNRDMGSEAQGLVAIDSLDAANALIHELDKHAARPSIADLREAIAARDGKAGT